MYSKIFVSAQFMFMIAVVISIVELYLEQKLAFGALLLLISMGIMLQAVGAKYLDQTSGDEG